MKKEMIASHTKGERQYVKPEATAILINTESIMVTASFHITDDPYDENEMEDL